MCISLWLIIARSFSMASGNIYIIEKYFYKCSIWILKFKNNFAIIVSFGGWFSVCVCMCVFFVFVFVYCVMIWRRKGLLQNCYVADNGLEYLNFLHLLLKYWNNRHVSPQLASLMDSLSPTQIYDLYIFIIVVMYKHICISICIHKYNLWVHLVLLI